MTPILRSAAIALSIAAFAFAQSPAATESKTISGKTVTITYASPGVKGREGKLFGPDGQIGKDRNYPIWRAGANAATKLQTTGDLDLGGLAVPAGDYTLYVDLTNPSEWTLVVNKKTGQWGLSYDKASDLGRVKMKMSKPPALVENLKYTLTDSSLTLAWENHVATVPLKVK
jgi:hypothetical protein